MHGEPLGARTRSARRSVSTAGPRARSSVPDEVRQHFAQGIGARGRELRETWERLACAMSASTRRSRNRSVPSSDGSCRRAGTATSPRSTPTRRLATRKASNQVQNAIAPLVPWMISGLADLTDSTSVRPSRGPTTSAPMPRAAATRTTGSASTRPRRPQRPLALEAAPNLIDLPRILGLRAVRDLFVGADGAAGDPHLHAHDSIGLGEDGLTHQPVEHPRRCAPSRG